MGQHILMRKTVFPPNCIKSMWCQAVFSASPSPFHKGAFTHLHHLLGCSAVSEESGSKTEAPKCCPRGNDCCYEHCYTIPKNPLATGCQELTHWKRPWRWEGLGVGGEGGDRGWDGWMASLTQWTWVWANSGSRWWTGWPDVLQSVGSQRVRCDWARAHTHTHTHEILVFCPLPFPCVLGTREGIASYPLANMEDLPFWRFAGCPPHAEGTLCIALAGSDELEIHAWKLPKCSNGKW